jgi:hypothetical protein
MKRLLMNKRLNNIEITRIMKHIDWFSLTMAGLCSVSVIGKINFFDIVLCGSDGVHFVHEIQP